MATNYFRGDAPLIAQVEEYEVGGTPAATDSISITIGQNTVTYTLVSGDDASESAAALQALLQVAGREFSEVVWTVSGDTITGTSAVAGRPFVTSVSDTGTVTLTKTSITSSGGPSHGSDPLNWSLGHAPQASEDIVVGGSSLPPLLYDIDFSSVAAASWKFKANYRGRTGLPRWNPNGYFEYRGTALKIRAPIVVIGEGVGAGSSFMRLDVGSSAASAVTIYSTGRESDSDTPAVMLCGSHASHSLRIAKGSVGLAFYPEDTCNFPTVNTGFLESEASDVKVIAGAGASFTTLDQNGGEVVLQSAVTTWQGRSGKGTVSYGGSIGSFYGVGAMEMNYLSSGTIGLADLGGGSFLNMKGINVARTVSVCKMRKGSKLHDPSKSATFSAGVELVDCGIEDVELLLGKRITLARS